jgi:hypothetical protein
LLEEIRGMAGVSAEPLLVRPPATVDRESPFVLGLREAAATFANGETMSVGHDGATGAVSFLRVDGADGQFGSRVWRRIRDDLVCRLLAGIR